MGQLIQNNQTLLLNSIIGDYTRNGYDFPKSRILLAKSLASRIPACERLEGLPDGDIITVWRGDSTDDDSQAAKMRSAVSWTTDLSVAVWFADRIHKPNTPNGLGAVWQAQISREDIIAFTQEREESEVLQFGDVIDPHIIVIHPLDWDTLLRKRIDHCRKSLGLL